MSEYIVQRNSLVNVADEIRVLSGTTEELGLDEMASNVVDANNEVANQEALIAELSSALDGKSVEGEGVRIETCTVTISIGNGTGDECVHYNTLDATGSLSSMTAEAVYSRYMSTISMTDVVCSSHILLIGVGDAGAYIDGTSELLFSNSGAAIFKAPAIAGEDCYITL